MVDLEGGNGRLDDDPTYTHVGDIWRLLGLSENGFRLYERKGIVSPSRNEENGYRVLSLSDGLRLCNAYDLTRMGLSINATAELLDGSLEDGIDMLRRHGEGMGRQLQELLANKTHLDEMVRSLCQYVEDPLRCTVVRDASLVFMPAHNQDMSLNHDPYDDGKRWWRAAPLVDAGLLVTMGVDGGAVEAIHGPFASERTCLQRELPQDHALHFCHRGEECLRFFAKFPAGALPGADAYVHAFVYLAGCGRTMRGEHVLHRMLRHVVEDGRAMRVDEVYMPLESVEGPAGGQPLT